MLSSLAGKCADYLRLLLFMAAVLVGVQLPGFVQQYENALQAHLAEARLSLAPFVRDAQIHTGGSLQALIARYQQNADMAVRAGGSNIQALAERVSYLEQRLDKLSGNPLQRAWHSLIRPDKPLFNEVRRQYDYQVPLDLAAIGWGLVVGLIVMVLLDILLGLLRLTGMLVAGHKGHRQS